jgi:hypothetical protein
VLSSHSGRFDSYLILVGIVFLFVIFSLPVTANPQPHEKPYPEWQSISNRDYCSMYSAYLNNQGTVKASLLFTYWKTTVKNPPLQLQAYFPEVISYEKPSSLKIVYYNQAIQEYPLFTINRFERSVWLKENNEEDVISSLEDVRLITVSAIGISGKEHIFNYSINHNSFTKEKNWLFKCINRDKEYLKYLKKSFKKLL